MPFRTDPPLDPLIGRTHELARATGAVDAAFSGWRTVLFLVGEAGIGKTRLAQEMARDAAVRTMTVCWGYCHVEAPAYWPWTRVLDTLCTHLGSAAVDVIGSHGARLAPLLPSLAGESTPPRGGDRNRNAAHARFELFDAVTGLLRRATAITPLVVILEDLHWADRSSLLLLDFVAREIGEAPLLLVGTYREHEARRQASIRTTLADVARRGERLDLSGLEEADTARLVAERAGTTLDDDLTRSIHLASQGNPFFIGELVRVLRSDGLLDARHSRTLRIPEEVRDVIRRRVHPLSAGVTEVLTVAAVMGLEFDATTIARATGLAPAEVLTRLAEAVSAGLIEPGRFGRHRFRHILTPDTLVDDLPAGVRAGWHQRIGEAIEALPADAQTERLEELAHHFLEAAQLDTLTKAVSYLAAAGERALMRVAYEEAVRHFERATQVFRLGGSDAGLRARVWSGLGTARHRSGDGRGAREAFREAIDAGGSAGDHEAAARAAIGFVDARPPDGSPDRDGIAVLEQALRAHPDAGELRALLLARLSQALYFADEPERCLTLGADAVAMARRLDDPATLASVLASRHFTLWGPGNPTERLALATEILSQGRRAGRPEVVMEGRRRRLVDLAELGDIASFDRELAAFADDTGALPLREHRQQLEQWRAMRAMLAGRHAEALQLAYAAHALMPADDAGNADQVLGIQLVILGGDQRRLTEMSDGVAQVLQMTGRGSVWRTIGMPLYLLDLGQVDAAREAFAMVAARDFTDLPRDMNYACTLVLLGRSATRLGDVPRARRLYDMLRAHPVRAVVVGWAAACVGSVERYLAELATTCGRRTEAVQHFETALTENTRMGALPYVAHVQHEYARFLLTRADAGDVPRATALLADCRRTAGALGMTRLLSTLDEIAPELPGTASRIAELRREGEVWALTCGDATVRVRDAKGLRYLAFLLERPGESIAASDLLREVGGGDGGVSREHARLSVRKAIAAAVARLDELHPVAVAPLRAVLHTGLVCRYEPTPATTVRWTISTQRP